ncbi:hypothetical protein AGR4C_Lc90230 [Agrobacterium tumefaciens str. Kerr 14]|uniref:Uncharacterized protein n=1 Tax=Agrobacterium tumefaciens str. Kerr 14 TaxID=1183424 RepID=A0A1S7S8E0_AGRTU|nr:hypothetical protein AGR4C_Lc90230 [Agrobacterium tumefaciens str. Kerr 14]
MESFIIASIAFPTGLLGAGLQILEIRVRATLAARTFKVIRP